MVEILIYSTLTCPYCVNAKNLLDAKGVSYNEIRVDTNPDKLKEMLTKSNRKTVPQIFIAGEHVGGFTELKQLNDSGKLDQLLA